MSDKPWKATELAWLAGLLEGEGHFGYMSYTPRVDLWASDHDTIAKAAAICGKKVRTRKPQRQLWKAQYGFTACGRDAIGIMLTVFVLMGHRRRNAITTAVQRWRGRQGRLV